RSAPPPLGSQEVAPMQTNEREVVALERPAIDVRALRKTYAGGAEAVKDIDFQVAAGEVFGLLGPNGAGKSTTIGMLTTTIAPTGGRAQLAGFDVATEPLAARAVSSVVFQDAVVDRELSGHRNLDLHARLWRVRPGTASEPHAEPVQLVGRAWAGRSSSFARKATPRRCSRRCARAPSRATTRSSWARRSPSRCTSARASRRWRRSTSSACEPRSAAVSRRWTTCTSGSPATASPRSPEPRSTKETPMASIPIAPALP